MIADGIHPVSFAFAAVVTLTQEPEARLSGQNGWRTANAYHLQRAKPRSTCTRGTCTSECMGPRRCSQTICIVSGQETFLFLKATARLISMSPGDSSQRPELLVIPQRDLQLPLRCCLHLLTYRSQGFLPFHTRVGLHALHRQGYVLIRVALGWSQVF